MKLLLSALSILAAATAFALPAASAASDDLPCASTRDFPGTFSCETPGPGVACSPLVAESALGAECHLTHVMCTSALWGVHSWPITVGGYYGCQVLVKVNPAAITAALPSV